eukprot:TRINITY_DN2201_c0_g2_i1.p2 TRINITY_DN2201_c0_g2~~TRINITY_DN2201_c0_g2_i1.p2  ORF type:complete len:141 (+),score=27.80 TRINITY_DN2201_c0_g2_i1:197-619(+)
MLKAAQQGQQIQSQQQQQQFTVDREKVCPLLVRVFPKIGGHHRIMDYEKRGNEPEGEIQIYTWMDATLRELADLVKDVAPAARKPNAVQYFAIVFPDRRGKMKMTEIGQVHCVRKGEDDPKTLKELNFETGDFLDVAIII